MADGLSRPLGPFLIVIAGPVTRPPPALLESRNVVMDRETRITIEMGRRALAFAEDHPAQIPANLPALSRLKELLTRADQLSIQQGDGIGEVRAATTEKRD